MNDGTALTSLALLKVDSDYYGNDYIDYLVPFVAFVLRKGKPDPVTSVATQALLKEEFKLELPVHPTELVLRRLAKKGYLQRGNHIYTIVKDLPKPEIEERRADVKEKLTSLILNLRAF